jgi:L-ribulose-5-phosphate 4-epimerase
MLERLKDQVLAANLRLVEESLVKLTWGNVSGLDPEHKLIVIKPSGVAYDSLTVDDLVVVDFEGNIVEGLRKPSSDTATHLELYRSFPEIGGVVHTHSTWATVFAQARLPIIPLGTTHADTFYGPVPCTEPLTPREISSAYELETGKCIVRNCPKYQDIPAVLVAGHGPFAWGESPWAAVEHAIILEEVARIAFLTQSLNPETLSLEQELLDKHYLRKHGRTATYGQ